MKNHSVTRILAVMMAPVLLLTALALPMGAETARAASQCPYFDFYDTVMTVAPGGSYKSYFESTADYAYYVQGATSKQTYVECSMKSGAQYLIYHIGPDETAKSVYFYFYVWDYRPEIGGLAADFWDSTEVRVKQTGIVPPAKTQEAPKKATASTALPVTVKGGKTWSLGLIQGETIAMLYDEAGNEKAAFSISDGTGKMPTLKLGAVVQQDGKNYFTVTTKKGNTVKIGDADKKMMIKKGFAGVCLNGTYLTW
ncbi:MAG: hypothetical protein II800_06305 [Lachnospiraceae bacterium]|nr:hypothetical protein [Lachnospiraceae bacterium]